MYFASRVITLTCSVNKIHPLLINHISRKYEIYSLVGQWQKYQIQMIYAIFFTKIM